MNIHEAASSGKPFGITLICSENFRAFIADLKLRSLPATASFFHSKGVRKWMLQTIIINSFLFVSVS